jgi:hypothetical protein
MRITSALWRHSRPAISFQVVAEDDAGLLRCNSDDKRLSAEPRIKQWSAFQSGGIKDVKTLQSRLVANTRRALNIRWRTFATDKGI